MKTEDRIDWLCRLRAWLECRSIDTYHNKNFIEAITDALKETPRWIPCSERLPNRDECIKDNGLFIVSDGNRSYSEWFDIYDAQMFGEPTMTGFRVDRAVTAWMALPEPYKAESEG